LAEAFRADPSRQVTVSGLSVALSVNLDLVPEQLRPNYERFLRKTYLDRARSLGWNPKPDDSEDIRLLRPRLVGAVATVGGDRELASQAEELAAKWLAGDRGNLSPEVAGMVLNTAAYYGGIPLFNELLAAFQTTRDRQEQRRLLGAMKEFRDPAAINAGMQSVLSGKIPLVDGFPLLLEGGRNSRATRRMPFEFVKANFDQIMKDKPSIFGNDFGTFLPWVGNAFCDAESRKELETYFKPIVNRYEGAARNLAQTLETVDLCIARVAAQRDSVREFLTKY
jgi:alanyl aminopeptidase